MNPLFEAWKLAFPGTSVLNGTTGNNRALTGAVEGAATPQGNPNMKRLLELYKPQGKTKTGPIEPNVGVPEAG
jgi:hypothetical protein